MPDQILNDVYVDCKPDDEGFVILNTINCPTLRYNSPDVTYVLVQLPDDVEAHSATFVNILRLKVKDADDESNDQGLADEYQVIFIDFVFDFFCLRVEF